MRKVIALLALVFGMLPLSSAWSKNNLIIGEDNGFVSNTAWEIRNSSGGAVSSGTLFAARFYACSVKLTNGNIFIGGGAASPNTWEIRSLVVLLSAVVLFGRAEGGLHVINCRMATSC